MRRRQRYRLHTSPRAGSASERALRVELPQTPKSAKKIKEMRRYGVGLRPKESSQNELHERKVHTRR